MSAALRSRLGYHVYEELPRDASSLAMAACWAVDYAAEIGKNNAKLVPRHFLGDRTDPPHVKDVDESVRTAWRDMFPLVQSHPARARLAHLLFQLGGAGGREMAVTAIDAYSQAAAEWQREADAVEDLRVANRIARAISDASRAAAAIQDMLNAVQKLLILEPPIPGVVISALTHAVADPDCPGDVDQILERAAQVLPHSDDRDQVLRLIFGRCSDDECRQRIWRRRIDAYIDSSEHAESEIARVLLRQKALQIADESGIKGLRQHAASLLQTARERDLELIRFEASSEIYNEHFEQYRDSFIAGDNWRRALISFAKCGPLNGDTDTNRQHVQARRELGPIQAQMPIHIFGPGNLPYFSAITDEERFEFDLIKVEVWHIQGIAAPLIAALHEIPNRFGLPTTQELAQFLHGWPGIHISAVPSIVIALQRFWTGDSHGAVHTLFPKIEALIRELLLRIDYGMYALAQAQRPGQYPALGPLIEALAGRFTISESGVRFLKVLLTEPAGLNIRNQLAHGIENYSDPGTAALLIHTALFVGTLEPLEQPDDEPTGQSTDAPTT